MAINDLYGDILMEHVSHPDHQGELDCATHSHEGVNPSCGDDLTLHICLKDGVIEEASWTGYGCAISKASADMMSELVRGKSVQEARDACQLFAQMIRGEQSDDQILEEGLDEAFCLKSISHMPARVKCAELAWRTLDEMLRSDKE